METNKNIMPENLIGWWDIVHGLGEVALEFLTKRFTSEAEPYLSEHFKERSGS